MTLDLATFDLTAMLRFGAGIRAAAAGARELETAAGAITRYMFEALRDPATGAPQLALARFYRTQSYGRLDPDQRAFADRLLGHPSVDRRLQCLCLLATTGIEPAWNDRRASRGHQAIPLPSPEMVEQAPMIAQLVRDFGLDLASVVRPPRADSTPLTEQFGRTYGVFHVEHARGSPYIPAQADFVEPYRIASVVGFGGALRAGGIFASILFSRAPITPAVADRFRNVALDVKAAIYNFSDG